MRETPITSRKTLHKSSWQPDFQKEEKTNSKTNDKTAGRESNIDIDREDKRHRRKESFIRTNMGEYERLEPLRKHGKDYHVEFRISPKAEAVLRATASLFKKMSPNQYAKAVLYHNLGLLYEPTDRRGAGENES